MNERTEYARTLENERDLLIDLRAENAELREVLNELDANCENRSDEPFVAYVRRTARVALAKHKGDA